MSNLPKAIERVLIATINGRGGVGKTFDTTVVASWLLYLGLLQTLWDCDDTQSLSRLMPEARRHNLKPSDGIESLIGKILETEVGLADCPANITAELVSLFASTEFGPSLESINGRLVVLVPLVANDAVALDEVRRMVAAVKDVAAYILVKNERDGEDFTAFDASATGLYLKSLGTPEVHFPKLSAKLQQLLNADRLTLAQFVGRFWELRETDPKAAFYQTVPAQQATNYLETIFAALNNIAPALLPTSLVSKLQPPTPDGIKRFCCQQWLTKQQVTNSPKENI